MGSQNIYIAVVDDDESICRSFSRLLRAAHFQPISYSSAEEFLADTKHPKFDCLVLDVQLLGMSGLELRKRLAAVRDSTPVVL
jgi:FixJ family two-component response regulator